MAQYRGAVGLAVLGLCVFVADGHSQSGDRFPTKRMTYQVRNAPAAALANALQKQFAAVVDFAVQVDTASGTLLLSGPAPVLDEASKVMGQLDQPPRSVVVEIIMVQPAPQRSPDGKLSAAQLDLAELAGPSDRIASTLEALREKGIILPPRRFRLTTVENQNATVSNTKQTASITGLSKSPGVKGVTSSTIAYRDVGVMITALARVHPGDTISVELKFDDSFSIQAPDGVVLGVTDRGEQVVATEFGTHHFKGKVLMGDGKAVVAAGVLPPGPNDPSRMVLIVTAKVLP